MSFSALFIRRPIGTTLLTVALGLAGALAYQFLPVAPLPRVEFPTIEVSATLPGANPHATCDQSPGTVPRRHPDRASHVRHRFAARHPRQLPRGGAGISRLSRQCTFADRGGSGDGLHCAGGLIRKLLASTHHPLPPCPQPASAPYWRGGSAVAI